MKCTCICHTHKNVRHVVACCCKHGYKANCPHEGCSRYRTKDDPMRTT